MNKEKPIFLARDPRVFIVTQGAPVNGRVFVTDQSRWYERLKNENGDGYFVHMADSDDAIQRRLEEEGEPALVEASDDNPLAAVVLEEFVAAGRLYPEVPVVTDEGLAAASARSAGIQPDAGQGCASVRRLRDAWVRRLACER